MRPYPVKYKPFRDHRKTRCIRCGKWVDLNREKYCPTCGKWSVERADKWRCEVCDTRLEDGDAVCPLCGGKQRAMIELRGVNPANLTEHAHLLREGQPHVSLRDCRLDCRTITLENPYRLSFVRKPEQIQDFIRCWNSLGGLAVACLPHETSRRPIVLLRSVNEPRQFEHARLVLEAAQKWNRAYTFADAAILIHQVNKSDTPTEFLFQGDFDHINEWVAAWRSLGGTAVRSAIHC